MGHSFPSQAPHCISPCVSLAFWFVLPGPFRCDACLSCVDLDDGNGRPNLFPFCCGASSSGFSSKLVGSLFSILSFFNLLGVVFVMPLSPVAPSRALFFTGSPRSGRFPLWPLSHSFPSTSPLLNPLKIWFPAV